MMPEDTLAENARAVPTVDAKPNVVAADTCVLQGLRLYVPDALYAGISASQLSTVPWSALVNSCPDGRLGIAPLATDTVRWQIRLSVEDRALVGVGQELPHGRLGIAPLVTDQERLGKAWPPLFIL